MNAKQRKNFGTKRKRNFQEGALHMKKRKIKLMEEKLIKKSQADEDYIFLTCLVSSIKNNRTTFKN